MPTILALFNSIIADHIKKIPLSLFQHEDKLVWMEEKSGKFSVRSAYRIIQHCKQHILGESSIEQTSTPLWRALWRMRVPHKIKVFAWRACLNGLPCFLNLMRKQIAIKGMCVFCDAHEEDLAHALLYCPNVWKWWLVFLPELDTLLHPMCFSILIQEFFNKFKGDNLTLLLWLHGAFGGKE